MTPVSEAVILVPPVEGGALPGVPHHLLQPFQDPVVARLGIHRLADREPMALVGRRSVVRVVANGP